MPLLRVRELALPGVVLADLERFIDERGAFVEVMRRDWDFFQEVAQVNLSVTYPGVVRAWHRHARGQVDHFIVVRGAAKICAYDDGSGGLVEVVMSGDKPQVLKVPGHYWHGFKAIGPEPAYVLYFVNRLYDYGNPDEERRPWNDPSIVPKLINGRTDDVRVGKPWDWFYPPHR